jgi:pimeloyl-ACP methyl ester carboxylesterase
MVVSGFHQGPFMSDNLPPYISHYADAPDGLRLHARDYAAAVVPVPDAGAEADMGAGAGPRLPVVCLPGLTRPAGDFHPLALHLSALGHRVVVPDYRGRGLSARAPDWRTYNLFTESGDIQAMLAALDIERALFIGTSRGGLHIMTLAAFRPDLLAAAVINDIGPVIEPAGLERIRGYVGKLPVPASYAEGIALLKRVFGPQFTGVDEAGWAHLASTSWIPASDGSGGLEPCFDTALFNTLADMDLSQPIPPLWPQFEAMADVPLLVIRGGLSDLLSAQTLEAMATRHPACQTYVVPGQGHAPLLVDLPTMARIGAFVASVRDKPAVA